MYLAGITADTTVLLLVTVSMPTWAHQRAAAAGPLVSMAHSCHVLERTGAMHACCGLHCTADACMHVWDQCTMSCYS